MISGFKTIPCVIAIQLWWCCPNAQPTDKASEAVRQAAIGIALKIHWIISHIQHKAGVEDG